MDDSYRCECGCFLTIEGAWVGESHYDDFAKVYCSNPNCKLKKKTKRQIDEEAMALVMDG